MPRPSSSPPAAPRRSWPLLAALLGLALVLAGCGGNTSDDQEAGSGGGNRLSIATGNTTGVYYQLGGALGRTWSRDAGVSATATETGASKQNVQLVVAGKQSVGFSLLDTASDAVRGENSFDEKQPIRALSGLYPNYTQVAVTRDSGVRSIADLKGKTVSTGSPQSGTEIIAERMLEVNGIDPDEDITRQRLSLEKSVEAMKDGQIDALVWSGGLPTPGITDLYDTLGDRVSLLDLDDTQPKLVQRYGDVYERAPIPADTYGGDDDVASIAVQNVLVVKDDFDPALGQKLVASMLKAQPELAKGVPAAKDISPESAADVAPLQLAEGSQEAIDAAGPGTR